MAEVTIETKEGVVIPFAPHLERRQSNTWHAKGVVAETASNDWEKGFEAGVRMGYEMRVRLVEGGGQ